MLHEKVGKHQARRKQLKIGPTIRAKKISWGCWGAVSSPGGNPEAPEISSFLMFKIPHFLTLKLVFFVRKSSKKFEINPKNISFGVELEAEKTEDGYFYGFPTTFLTLLRTMQTECISRGLR